MGRGPAGNHRVPARQRVGSHRRRRSNVAASAAGSASGPSRRQHPVVEHRPNQTPRCPCSCQPVACSLRNVQHAQQTVMSMALPIVRATVGPDQAAREVQDGESELFVFRRKAIQSSSVLYGRTSCQWNAATTVLNRANSPQRLGGRTPDLSRLCVAIGKAAPCEGRMLSG